MFFKVFPCFFGCFPGFSEEGLPPRPFHSLISVKGGVVFLDFKGKIVFGDPLASNSDPPLRGKFASKNTPKRDLRLGLDPQGKHEFLVLKSRVLGGLSFSGFLCFFKFFKTFP